MIKIIFRKIQNLINLMIFRKAWRKINGHNFTSVRNIFPIDKVIVGKKTYGPLQVMTYGNPNEKLVIGSYCSIAADVKFLLGGEHSYKGISTYPFKQFVCGDVENTLTKGPIIIKDDVWIGDTCLILSGVNIGQGAVIAAGSVVVKDIPPYAIYAGGRIIKYRFSEDIINQLIKFDYSYLVEEVIKDNIDYFYTDLTVEMLERDFIKKILNDKASE